ncbi:MAG: peptidase M23 [uncultured bacterium]|nr:MAG: peptidase M23 [uncultured bacterium]
MIGKWFVFLLVPIYRLLFSIKRQLAVVYRPAKNRMMLLVANRYTIHTLMICVVLVVGVMNLRTGVVRAEEFGRNSIMYGLVAEDRPEIVQEFAGDYLGARPASIHYREQTGISKQSLIAVAVLEEQQISENSIFGDGAIVATPVIEAGTSERSQVETYTIQSGDSLSSIASGYDLSINTLLWANNLSVSSVLRPGNTLTILPVDGVKHTVKSGDTIGGISRTYDVDQVTILSYNGLDNSDVLSIGDELLIPGGAVQATTRSTSSAISQLFATPTTSAVPTSVSSTTPGAGYMVWPTDLRVITQYYGWKHTGLDVDCYYDNYNYAADAGYVTYSGWNGGYGYAVDIDHGNGIVTRYGHNAALYVSAGQYVSAGEAIGLCGTTGRSTGTHLHFEVIVNGVKKNPLEYIR